MDKAKTLQTLLEAAQTRPERISFLLDTQPVFNPDTPNAGYYVEQLLFHAVHSCKDEATLHITLLLAIDRLKRAANVRFY